MSDDIHCKTCGIKGQFYEDLRLPPLIYSFDSVGGDEFMCYDCLKKAAEGLKDDK